MLQEEQSSFTTPAGNLPTNLSHLCALSQRFSGDITTLTIQCRAADLQGQLKLGCCLNSRLGPAIGSRILALTREANLFWCSICILGSLMLPRYRSFVRQSFSASLTISIVQCTDSKENLCLSKWYTTCPLQALAVYLHNDGLSVLSQSNCQDIFLHLSYPWVWPVHPLM